MNRANGDRARGARSRRGSARPRLASSGGCDGGPVAPASSVHGQRRADEPAARARRGCGRRAGPGSGADGRGRRAPAATDRATGPGAAGRRRSDPRRRGQRRLVGARAGGRGGRGVSTIAASPSSARIRPSASGPSRSRSMPEDRRGRPAGGPTAARRLAPGGSRRAARAPRRGPGPGSAPRRSSQPSVPAEVRPATSQLGATVGQDRPNGASEPRRAEAARPAPRPGQRAARAGRRRAGESRSTPSRQRRRRSATRYAGDLLEPARQGVVGGEVREVARGRRRAERPRPRRPRSGCWRGRAGASAAAAATNAR